ncbi:signal peptidase I [Patescibacteria group bacterium]|nr:signal peptidase I [Patescibacteria group bacterium]MBU2036377.1 signal peptidase I [Patescibacteria group bacterium]
MKREKFSPRFLSILTKIFTIVWILSIVVFSVVFLIATDFLRGTVQETQFGNSNLFTPFFLGSIIVGILAFGLLILTIIIKTILGKRIIKFKKSFKGFILSSVALFLLLAFLPLFLVYEVSGVNDLIKRIKKEKFKISFLRPSGVKSFVVRIVSVVAILVTFLPLWCGGYWLVGTIIGSQLGFISEPVTVSGTGSMYPTFPKGEGKDPKELSKQIIATSGMFPYPNGLVLFGKRVFGYQLGRGDIVLVENDKTREMTEKMYGTPSGWIKRIIGIGGDSIELKNGIVYLNDKPLPEPYTAKPHSTFGEAFLKECQKITVPENSIFVMGDNRKGSGDSREVGFFSVDSIKNILPLKSQKGDLVKYWRDISKDFDDSSKIHLNKEQYLELLNQKRVEAGAKPLKYQPKLELSAQKRGEIILKYDDFSFEATRSGYPMSKAMRDANYSNIVWGEAPTLGYYEADELVENQFEFPESKKFYTDKTYQEVGISEVEGSLNGCPAQIIVQHFAGYVPPNYKQADIDGWNSNLSRLKEIQPSWQNSKNYASYYEKNKNDVDRINEIISIRVSNITAIVSRMKSNQWLTSAEQKMIEQDQALYDEQESIANHLNGQ